LNPHARKNNLKKLKSNYNKEPDTMITWKETPKLLDKKRPRPYNYKESRTGSIERTTQRQLIFNKLKISSMKNLKYKQPCTHIILF
jgi:hypothetical protein